MVRVKVKKGLGHQDGDQSKSDSSGSLEAFLRDCSGGPTIVPGCSSRPGAAGGIQETFVAST